MRAPRFFRIPVSNPTTIKEKIVSNNNENTKPVPRKRYVARGRNTRLVHATIGPQQDADLATIKVHYKSTLGFDVSHSALYRRALGLLAHHLTTVEQATDDTARRREAGRLLTYLTDAATLNPAQIASLKVKLEDTAAKAERLHKALKSGNVSVDTLAEVNAFLKQQGVKCDPISEELRAGLATNVIAVAEAAAQVAQASKAREEDNE